MIEIEEVKNTQEKISPFIKKTELISSNVSKKIGLRWNQELTALPNFK